LEIPQIDLEAAGLEWLDDPVGAQEASSSDWEDALSVVTAYRIRLQLLAITAMNNGDKETVKNINSVLRYVKDTLSGMQTLMNALKHH
jgi:hypothetical protein